MAEGRGKERGNMPWMWCWRHGCSGDTGRCPCPGNKKNLRLLHTSSRNSVTSYTLSAIAIHSDLASLCCFTSSSVYVFSPTPDLDSIEYASRTTRNTRRKKTLTSNHPTPHNTGSCIELEVYKKCLLLIDRNCCILRRHLSLAFRTSDC